MRRSLSTSLLALALLATPVAAGLQGAGTSAAAAAPSSVALAPATDSALDTASAAALLPRTPWLRVARTTRTLGKPAARTVLTAARKPVAPKSAAPRPVAVPTATRAPAVTAASVTPAATTPAAVTPAAVGAYAFLHLDSGAPVRWNPCAGVPWTFNPAGAPAGGLAAVQAALAEISARTGLAFTYQGAVGTVPAGSYLTQSWGHFKPLLIGWTTSTASDLLGGRGDNTVGMTRVLWTGSYDSAGVNHTQIASGTVAFNSAVTAPTTGSGSWFTYALHELGHAVGLAHVDDNGQIMNPVISGSVAGYGSGDRAGLTLLGRGAGCLPEVR